MKPKPLKVFLLQFVLCLMMFYWTTLAQRLVFAGISQLICGTFRKLCMKVLPDFN